MPFLKVIQINLVLTESRKGPWTEGYFFIIFTRNIFLIVFCSYWKARRALRALKGLVRLKALVDGSIVKRQTEKTVQSIHAETRIQFEIHARRRQMVEENQAMQKQLQLKEKEESLKVNELLYSFLFFFFNSQKFKMHTDLNMDGDAYCARELCSQFAWRYCTMYAN